MINSMSWDLVTNSEVQIVCETFSKVLLFWKWNSDDRKKSKTKNSLIVCVLVVSYLYTISSHITLISTFYFSTHNYI
jgi:hypothetical protein